MYSSSIEGRFEALTQVDWALHSLNNLHSILRSLNSDITSYPKFQVRPLAEMCDVASRMLRGNGDDANNGNNDNNKRKERFKIKKVGQTHVFTQDRSIPPSGVFPIIPPHEQTPMTQKICCPRLRMNKSAVQQRRSIVLSPPSPAMERGCKNSLALSISPSSELLSRLHSCVGLSARVSWVSSFVSLIAHEIVLFFSFSVVRWRMFRHIFQCSTVITRLHFYDLFCAKTVKYPE